MAGGASLPGPSRLFRRGGPGRRSVGVLTLASSMKCRVAPLLSARVAGSSQKRGNAAGVDRKGRCTTQRARKASETADQNICWVVRSCSAAMLALIGKSDDLRVFFQAMVAGKAAHGPFPTPVSLRSSVLTSQMPGNLSSSCLQAPALRNLTPLPSDRSAAIQGRGAHTCGGGDAPLRSPPLPAPAPLARGGGACRRRVRRAKSSPRGGRGAKFMAGRLSSRRAPRSLFSCSRPARCARWGSCRRALFVRGSAAVLGLHEHERARARTHTHTPGCGSGYLLAALAHLVGPCGMVCGLEVL